MNFTVLRFETLGSTNTEALRAARDGAAEGLCILAEAQTAGRGRHGRKWISAKGAGLSFSIILRPGLEPRFLPLITLTAGVAVADTLKLFGLDPDIKWVNDVLVGGRKICGILAESADSEHGPAVVLGIGINLTDANFPPELALSATSVSSETGRDVSGSQFLERLLGRLEYFYDLLQLPDGPAKIIEEWRVRSSYYAGKSVTVRTGDETIEGTTDGLEENGALRVRTSTGETRIIYSGDVEKLRASEDEY